jgi:hypothetical protein
VLPHDFDGHHHAFVFVFRDVAVKHEAPDNLRVCKRDDELGLARFSIPHWRNAKGVAKTVEIGGSAVDFSNQKSSLMNMKVVVLGIFVEDCPFFGVTQLHCYVRPVLIKDLVVYKEGRLLWIYRKCDVRLCAIGLERNMSTYSGPFTCCVPTLPSAAATSAAGPFDSTVPKLTSGIGG